MPTKKKRPKSKRAHSNRVAKPRARKAPTLGNKKEPPNEAGQHHYRTIALSRIDELIQIAENPDSFGNGRDEASRYVIGRCVEAVGEFVTWAIEHQIGLVIAGVEANLSAPPGFEADRRYRTASDDANKAVHQATGANYDFNDEILNRQILSRIISLVASRMDGKKAAFLRSLAKGFLALNSGETIALFERSVSRRRGLPFSLDEAKQRACGHVAYRVAMQETTKSEAITHVAKALGVQPASIVDWYHRNTTHSPKRRDLIIDHATALGRAEYARRAQGINSIAENKFSFAEHLYGEEALKDLAAKFTRANHHRVKLGTKPRLSASKRKRKSGG